MSKINRYTARMLLDQCHNVAQSMSRLGNPQGSEAQRVLSRSCDRVIALCRTDDPYGVNQSELQREMRHIVIAFQRVEADVTTMMMDYLQQVKEGC